MTIGAVTVTRAVPVAGAIPVTKGDVPVTKGAVPVTIGAVQ